MLDGCCVFSKHFHLWLYLVWCQCNEMIVVKCPSILVRVFLSSAFICLIASIEKHELLRFSWWFNMINSVKEDKGKSNETVITFISLFIPARPIVSHLSSCTEASWLNESCESLLFQKQTEKKTENCPECGVYFPICACTSCWRAI